jgi:hypothetical protein
MVFAVMNTNRADRMRKGAGGTMTMMNIQVENVMRPTLLVGKINGMRNAGQRNAEKKKDRKKNGRNDYIKRC